MRFSLVVVLFLNLYKNNNKSSPKPLTFTGLEVLLTKCFAGSAILSTGDNLIPKPER